MGSLLDHCRWWHGPFGLLLLIAAQRLNRRNVVGLVLWSQWHGFIRMPIVRAWRWLCGRPPAPFPMRAQIFIDATRYTTREWSMRTMNSTLTSMATVACKLGACPISPVESLTAPALLRDSSWFGSADLNDGLSVILYVHGGGFCLGSAKMFPAAFRSMIDGALAAGVSLRVLSVEYPLSVHVGKGTADPPLDAPDSSYASRGFQGMLHTTLAAWDYLIDEVGLAPHQIVIAGDSAGGNLAVTTCIALRDRAIRQGVLGPMATDVEVRATMPAAMLLFSPWTDLSDRAIWRRPRQPLDLAFTSFAPPHSASSSSSSSSSSSASSMTPQPSAALLDTRGGMGCLDYLEPATLDRFSRFFLANSNNYARELVAASASASGSGPASVGAASRSGTSTPTPSLATAASWELGRVEVDTRTCAVSFGGASMNLVEGEVLDQPLSPESLQATMRARWPTKTTTRSRSPEPSSSSSSSRTPPRRPSLTVAASAAATPSSPSASSSSPTGASEFTPITASFPLISPVYADLSSLPPAHLCFGGGELLCADILAFRGALMDAGVVVSETFHPLATHDYALARDAWGAVSDRALALACRFVTSTLLTQQQIHVPPKQAMARNLFSTAHFIDPQ